MYHRWKNLSTDIKLVFQSSFLLLKLHYLFRFGQPASPDQPLNLSNDSYMSSWQTSADIVITPVGSSSTLSNKIASYPAHDDPRPAQLVAQMDRNFATLRGMSTLPQPIPSLRRTTTITALDTVPPAVLDRPVDQPPPPLGLEAVASLINVNNFPYRPSQKDQHMVSKTIMSCALSAPRREASEQKKLDFGGSTRGRGRVLHQRGLVVPPPEPGAAKPCTLAPRETDADKGVQDLVELNKQKIINKLRVGLFHGKVPAANATVKTWTCEERDNSIKEYCVLQERRARNMSRDVLLYEINELKSLYSQF